MTGICVPEGVSDSPSSYFRVAYRNCTESIPKNLTLNNPLPNKLTNINPTYTAVKPQ